jgi:hypothetical protein
VISVGKDKQILHMRAKLLIHGGYSVRSMAPEDAETDARSPTRCVWIFCSSVDLAQLIYLACSIRRYSHSSRLLLIEGSRPIKFEAALFHRVLKDEDGGSTLIAAVSEMAA